MNINLLNIPFIPCIADISYWTFVNITIKDFTILPIYLLIIYLLAYFHKMRKIESDPCRKTKPPGESDFEITKRIAHTLQALVNLLLKQFPKV